MCSSMERLYISEYVGVVQCGSLNWQSRIIDLCLLWLIISQGWVSSGRNLFLSNLRFKPAKNGKNQNAGARNY